MMLLQPTINDIIGQLLMLSNSTNKDGTRAMQIYLEQQTHLIIIDVQVVWLNPVCDGWW